MHTPGPWTNDGGLVNGLDSRPRFAGEVSPDIFNADDWSTELSDEAMANAALIAAAPDLLAACKEARFRLFGTGPAAQPLGYQLDAAIAKATTP